MNNARGKIEGDFQTSALKEIHKRKKDSALRQGQRSARMLSDEARLQATCLL